MPASYPGSLGPNNDEVALGLFGQNLPLLGSGIDLPLFKNEEGKGLISLAQAGLFGSWAEATSHTESYASSGVLTTNGSIAVSPQDVMGTDFAYIDLVDLFEQVGIDVFTDNILDQARFEIGGLASSAECTDCECESSYAIAGANLNLRSPLVGTLSTVIQSALDTAIIPIDALVNENGPLNGALGQIKNAINAVQVSSFLGGCAY